MTRLRITVLSVLLLMAADARTQVLTEWVESKAAGETDKIALGYPVPIPVNTPLPFDGFRTYAGLHARHQDLMNTTPWVHQSQVGTTRAGRSIWAYLLGDEDLLTAEGLPEPATLTNGGIHAREWQTPEVVTGIMELMALHEQDRHFYDYLRENVNMVVIPSLNIDGFLQTQRYPSLNYMQSDPDNPDYSPRDGRMRRKNMLSADEDLYTTFDHLNGVDLNRNNAPYWASNPGRSSPNLNSIVHHGAQPASEPEIQALDVAAHLGPIDRLRIYTDVHSFSQVHFWVRNDNMRLTQQTSATLGIFSDHHRSFPAAKDYYYARSSSVPYMQGIGLTDEYFTHVYQVPSWTLEVEPSGGQSYHYPLPGNGADYGGVVENGHDGFILPESEIRRVREQLAQSFAAVYYRQAGPPTATAVQIFDVESGALIVDAAWDVSSETTRELHFKQLQPLKLGREYDIWTAFNKPMRWRENGEVTYFPGRGEYDLPFDFYTLVGETNLEIIRQHEEWLNQPLASPAGYQRYQDDAHRLRIKLLDNTANQALVNGQVAAKLRFRARDMTALRTDANPATVADWEDGGWLRYENEWDTESSAGGYNVKISYQLTNQDLDAPFLLEPGMTAAWYDPGHDGEGFLLEMLADNVAVMYWFTYDESGNQDWYVMVGEVLANRIAFPTIYRVSGGVFGPDFDPANITEEVVGSASFLWSSCDQGDMSYRIGHKRGRLQLSRLTRLMGIDCGQPMLPPINESALLSGSWSDPTHNGEGYNIEVLVNGQVLVYWFSYGPGGERRWFFGIGDVIDGKLVFNDIMTTSGGIFGDDFDPLSVQYTRWGTLEMDLNCNSGIATYNSTEEGFGSGTLNVQRLTSIDGWSCPE